MIRPWSLEECVVKAVTIPAVIAQGVIDFFSPMRPVDWQFATPNNFPIPGCPRPGDCREHGCAGDCSEASEAEGRMAECDGHMLAEPWLCRSCDEQPCQCLGDADLPGWEGFTPNCSDIGPVNDAYLRALKEQSSPADAVAGDGSSAACDIPPSPAEEPLTVSDPLASAIRARHKTDPDARIVCYLTDRNFEDRQTFELTGWEWDKETGVMSTEWASHAEARRLMTWPEQGVL